MAEIGDMISYNVGGMLKHSLGVVLDKKVVADNRQGLGSKEPITFYKIVWYRLGRYKPKVTQRYQISHKTDPKDVIFLGDRWMGAGTQTLLNQPDWFECYDCFPKVKMNKK